MLFPNRFLSLLVAGIAAASPIEERAPQSCTISSIQNIVTAVFKPSAVPFCNAYLSVPVRTVTAQVTVTPKAQNVVTKTATATNTVTITSTIPITVKYSVMAAVSVTAQTSSVATNGRFDLAADSDTTAEGGSLERRAPTFTPSRFRTLAPNMISSVCSCITTISTVTISNVRTASAGTSTKTVTTTVTQSIKTTVQHTVTASPAAFYLQMAKTSGTTADGLYGLVNGESMDFISGSGGASKFAIDANGYLVSQTNGWVANIQPGYKYSTLFFDSPALIKNLTLVPAVCSRSTGNLVCTDQTATSLYYCDFFGTELVIAGAAYQGAGCKNATLNVISA